MESTSDKLFKGFVELCEELVTEAYLITDGRQVLTAVLDHSVATKLCKTMIKRTGDPNWKVTKIADGVELAWRNGYLQGCREMEMKINANGDANEEDSELRDGGLQSEEESN